MKKVKEHSLLLQYDRLRIGGAEALTDPDLDGGEDQCCVKCGHRVLKNEWGRGVCACKTDLWITHNAWVFRPEHKGVAKPCRLFTEGDIQ